MTIKQSRPNTSSSGEKGESERRDGAPYRAAVSAAKRARAEAIPYPNATEIDVLHERVLIGHPDAVEALIERLLPLLTALVRRAFPRAPEDLMMNAVEDALLEYSGRRLSSTAAGDCL